MKRLLSTLIVLAWITTVGAFTLPATDNFPGIASAALSASWTTFAGSFEQGGSGDARSSFGGGAVSKAYWNADTFPDDQYAQATVTITNSSAVAAVMVRASNTGGGQYYACIAFGIGDGIYMVKNVSGGGETTITNFGTTFTNGDLLKMDAIGSTLRCFKNGAQLGTDQTDSAIASGSAGMMSYLAQGTLGAFEAGAAGGGGGGPSAPKLLPMLGVGL